MKLVDLTCPGCGANVTIGEDGKTAVCTVCGKQMILTHTGEFGEAYDREMGRLQAVRDVEDQWKKEREEKIRQKEEEKRLAEEKAEKDRIKKQLGKICIAEGVICFLLFVSSFTSEGGLSQNWLRIPVTFIQLALIAAVTLFFTRDKFFVQIILACAGCVVLSIVSSCFSSVIWCYVVFNLLKLIWMMRVERVSYSWEEMLHSVNGKSQNKG